MIISGSYASFLRGEAAGFGDVDMFGSEADFERLLALSSCLGGRGLHGRHMARLNGLTIDYQTDEWVSVKMLMQMGDHTPHDFYGLPCLIANPEVVRVARAVWQGRIPATNLVKWRDQLIADRAYFSCS